MNVSNILQSVADQVNAGALGPDVTASVSGGADRVQKLADKITAMGPEMVEKAQAAITLLKGTPDRPVKTPAGQLPDSILDAFRQYRGTTDDTFWQLGDAIDSVCVEWAGRITQRKVYKAAALETEYSLAEVRLLHETARAFDTSLRNQYDDVLTHQHYRVLRYIDDRARKAAYLAWCVESADQFNGRAAPASVLKKKVQRDMGIEPPEPTPAELLERAIAALTRYRDVAEGRHHARANEALGVLEAIA